MALYFESAPAIWPARFPLMMSRMNSLFPAYRHREAMNDLIRPISTGLGGDGGGGEGRTCPRRVRWARAPLLSGARGSTRIKTRSVSAVSAAVLFCRTMSGISSTPCWRLTAVGTSTLDILSRPPTLHSRRQQATTSTNTRLRSFYTPSMLAKLVERACAVSQGDQWWQLLGQSACQGGCVHIGGMPTPHLYGGRNTTNTPHVPS